MVPPEEEEAAIFNIAAASASHSPMFLPMNKRARNLRFGLEKHKQPQQISQKARGLALGKK